MPFYAKFMPSVCIFFMKVLENNNTNKQKVLIIALVGVVYKVHILICISGLYNMIVKWVELKPFFRGKFQLRVDLNIGINTYSVVFRYFSWSELKS